MEWSAMSTEMQRAEGAAARLGIKRTTLLFRIKKLGIDPKLFC
jgi:transcriptional regulator with GAF, ATPase, and Fis domain